ncbi:hypothetical protein O181_130023 [Austropuccinia psidii MF-1]|uniref:Uncharacterized protein n=1 Tax=Austropuccinia psidii MF-1 TaxID=1389203 RepID=A0A9Q3KXU6_9BASI|nr:hypothetical protein [Austropuccinia psidii MF-1]
MTERDQQELECIITQGCFLTVAQVTDLMTCMIHSRFPTSPCHWTINDWAWVFWTDELAFELGKKVNHVRAWRIPQEKWNLENLAVNHQSASLVTGPASIHSLDGVGPVDLWLPPPPFDGGQCPHPHGLRKHRLARLAQDPEARLAGSFTQLESHQKCMEDDEELNK